MTIAVIVPYYPTEETAALFKRCQDSIDKRFEVYTVFDFNGDGVSKARNRGIDEAIADGCDYITFLDADDTYVPNAWEIITGAISEAPDAPIIQLNHRRQDSTGRSWVKYYNRRGTYGISNLPVFGIVCWNKIIKADAVGAIRFIEGLNRGEDELFIFELMAKTRTVYCSEGIHLVHHFDNPRSLSKIADIDDLLAEQNALNGFMKLNKADREITGAIRARQAQLWDGPVYKKIFGG
jgi:glycosyltransferase involved in cell wall biosynthesis